MLRVSDVVPGLANRTLIAQCWVVDTSVLQRMQTVPQPLHLRPVLLPRLKAAYSNSCARWQLRRAQPHLPHLEAPVGIMLAASLQPAPCNHCRSGNNNPSCSHPAVFKKANGLLQLGQLTNPAALTTVWQQQIKPACLQAWEDLHSSNLIQSHEFTKLFVAQEHGHAAAESQQPTQQQGQLLPQEYLQKLDLLLGSLQQVLLVCGLLKDQHNQQEWQTVAAAVFVDARTVEQQICSDLRLQQGLLLSQQHLSWQHQQQRDSNSISETHSNADCLLLVKALKKHMQLEGLNPQGFAGLGPMGNPELARAQVLSVEEQQRILSGLQAEHKVLLNRMQDLLLNPAAAPTVHMDANSRDVLMQPWRSGLTPLASSGYSSEAQHCAAAARQQVPAAGAVGEQRVEVVLDFKLVQKILQQHPDAAVRADVWSAGVLQQLDKLLLLSKDLSEVRRKIASMQGHSCYADLVLQHSLLGSSAAAVAVCEQLAGALLPAATAAAEQLLLQQEQQQLCGPSTAKTIAAPQLQGSDVEYILHQSRLEILTNEDLQQLQPYVELQHVMSGFDRLLQLSLGLSVRPRPAAAGEVWNERVQVYELFDTGVDTGRAQKQQQQQQQGLSSVDDYIASVEKLLGTIYIDPSGGFSAQLVLYGIGYHGVWLGGPQQEQLEPATGGSKDRPASETHPSSGSPVVPCAVALGLQSHGILGGTHSQLALGLWELCHELGHAVNFLLSAAARSEPQTAAADAGPGAAETAAVTASAAAGQSCHMHAAWLPLEIIELPSTLFEGFCMDPRCLQVLCHHHHDAKQQMPWELATKVAGFMRASHYNALMYQHTVLAMLFDLQMTTITGRQLGRHAAHVTWQQVMTAEGLAAAPQLEVCLQQLTSLPRLLVSCGQGYGYAVAWCLAQLLMPSLLQHIHQAAASQDTCSSSEASVADFNSTEGLAERAVEGRLLWRRFFSSGVGMSDVLQLAELTVQLQQAMAGDPAAGMRDRAGSDRTSGTFDPTALGPDARFEEHVHPDERVDGHQLEHALRRHGLWPLITGTCDPEDVLVVCLTVALQTVRRRC